MNMTEQEAEIILAFARNNMRLNHTAQALHYHVSNVRYHFEKIEKKTGLNPRSFYDLLKLLRNAKQIKEA